MTGLFCLYNFKVYTYPNEFAHKLAADEIQAYFISPPKTKYDE